MTQKRSCPYKLRFGTYPRGPPFFGSYRGHYPIVEFEIWPFQPRVKLSLSTMRPLIDIFSRCSCNVARSLRVLFLTLSPPRGLPLSLPRYPLTSFFFSLRTSRSGPVQSPGPNASTLVDSHSPSTWFILNPCSLSPWSRPQTRFCRREKMILRNWRALRSIVVFTLCKILPRWRSLLCRASTRIALFSSNLLNALGVKMISRLRSVDRRSFFVAWFDLTAVATDTDWLTRRQYFQASRACLNYIYVVIQ